MLLKNQNNKLGDLPVHIDIEEINRGTYNKDVSKYIESDLEPKNHFHSPQFIVDNVETKREAAKQSKEEIPPVKTFSEIIAEPETPKQNTTEIKTDVLPDTDFFDEMLGEVSKNEGDQKPKFSKVSKQKTKLNIEKTLAWFKNNAPNIPLEIVEASHSIFKNGGLLVLLTVLVLLLVILHLLVQLTMKLSISFLR